MKSTCATILSAILLALTLPSAANAEADTVINAGSTHCTMSMLNTHRPGLMTITLAKRPARDLQGNAIADARAALSAYWRKQLAGVGYRYRFETLNLTVNPIVAHTGEVTVKFSEKTRIPN
jgi:hypothetical protein